MNTDNGDMSGSTKRFDQLPERCSSLLARHRLGALLATAALILMMADAGRQVFADEKPNIGALTLIAIGLMVISPVWTTVVLKLVPPETRSSGKGW